MALNNYLVDTERIVRNINENILGRYEDDDFDFDDIDFDDE